MQSSIASIIYVLFELWDGTPRKKYIIEKGSNENSYDEFHKGYDVFDNGSLRVFVLIT